MLSKRNNFLETLKKNGRPDRLVNQYEAFEIIMNDPITQYIQGVRHPGDKNTFDRWGTHYCWPENGIFPNPDCSEKYKVIKDITCWKDFVRVPDVVADCSDQELWLPVLEIAGKIDKNEKMVALCATTGLFERLHFLMGFEDTLVNFLLEPEAMKDLCEAIGEYRYNGFKLMCKMVKPEVIISHDDWGSKQSLFLSPDTWREFIKPAYQKAYNLLKDNNVIIIHHSDSFLEPIVEDLIDLKIDVWQGVLPQNNVEKISEQIDGRMALMGGLDSAIIDRPDADEAIIRENTRTVCERYGNLGYFIPSVTYGGPGTVYPGRYEIISDEIKKYNYVHYNV